jgi:hypothetical protein
MFRTRGRDLFVRAISVDNVGELGTGDSRIENPGLLCNASIRLFHLQAHLKLQIAGFLVGLRGFQNILSFEPSRFSPLALECGGS